MSYNKKIVILAYTMYGGGLEKQIANVSDTFAKHNFDVDLILWNDEIGYDTDANIINLGKLFGSNLTISGFKKMNFIKKYLNENQVEIILDYRFRTKPLKELLWTYFIFNNKKVFHTVQNSKLSTYGFKYKWLVKYIYRKNQHLVCVSNDIQNKIQKDYPYLKNVHTIYNMVKIEENSAYQVFNFEHEFILYAGRIDAEVKQVDKLIASYKKTALYKNNVHLVLVGCDGKSNRLKNLVNELDINEFVHFYEFQANIQPFFKGALFTVLCSLNEGFPVILLESLINETPLISFDCPTGPSEIIMDNYNGRLIENQNFNKLEESMKALFFDRNQLNFMKSNTLKSVEKFKSDHLIKNWLKLIDF